MKIDCPFSPLDTKLPLILLLFTLIGNIFKFQDQFSKYVNTYFSPFLKRSEIGNLNLPSLQLARNEPFGSNCNDYLGYIFPPPLACLVCSAFSFPSNFRRATSQPKWNWLIILIAYFQKHQLEGLSSLKPDEKKATVREGPLLNHILWNLLATRHYDIQREFVVDTCT